MVSKSLEAAAQCSAVMPSSSVAAMSAPCNDSTARTPQRPINLEPIGKLTYTLYRQIGQITKNLQGWDLSLVGKALNTTIANYKARFNITSSPGTGIDSLRRNTQVLSSLLRTEHRQSDPFYSSMNAISPEDPSTLRGLELAFTAIANDMLISYGPAQLMVANDTKQVPARLSVSAIAFGSPIYIWVIFGLNTLVLVLVGVQAWWTGLWLSLIHI